MQNINVLEKEWLKYRDACYPPGSGPTSPVQIHETRQAFYAGGFVVINLLWRKAAQITPAEADNLFQTLRQEAVQECMAIVEKNNHNN